MTMGYVYMVLYSAVVVKKKGTDLSKEAFHAQQWEGTLTTIQNSLWVYYKMPKFNQSVITQAYLMGLSDIQECWRHLSDR